jgi:hypothetical protein
VHDAASAITAPDTDHLPAYRLFREAVTRAQLAAWLPRGRQVLVDVSGPRAPSAELAAQGLRAARTGARLSVSAIVFGLAGHAAGRVGTRVEPAFGYLESAVDASPVGVLLDAAQRGEYLGSLAAG